MTSVCVGSEESVNEDEAAESWTVPRPSHTEARMHTNVGELACSR